MSCANYSDSSMIEMSCAFSMNNSVIVLMSFALTVALCVDELC